MKISVLTPTIRVQGLEENKKSLEQQTFRDFEWLVELNVSGKHDLNAAYNRMLRRAKGELVVSMQDWVKAPADYLQKFSDSYERDKRTFYTAPVGKVHQLDYQSDIVWDWRADRHGKIEPQEWEIDSGAAPLQAFFDIGGFDEALDGNWSFDNVSVGIRAAKHGYSFENLHNNPVLAFDHDILTEHPFRDSQRKSLINLRLDSYTDEPLPYL